MEMYTYLGHTKGSLHHEAFILGQPLYLEQTVLLKRCFCLCHSETVVFQASSQSSGLYPFSCPLSQPQTKNHLYNDADGALNLL